MSSSTTVVITNFNQTINQTNYNQITIAVLTSLLSLLTILGNGLIIVSVVIVRKLRQPANYLIVSLAFSDFLVGVVVLPMTIYYNYNDSWDLPSVACDIYVSFDVICCGASIMNLCMISIDRYMMITKPMVYPKKRTARLMTSMIILSWALSCIIIFPALFGYTDNVKKDGMCLISQEKWFTVYSTTVSFYMPLLVILSMYWKIFREASKFSSKDKKRKLPEYQIWLSTPSVPPHSQHLDDVTWNEASRLGYRVVDAYQLEGATYRPPKELTVDTTYLRLPSRRPSPEMIKFSYTRLAPRSQSSLSLESRLQHDSRSDECFIVGGCLKSSLFRSSSRHCSPIINRGLMTSSRDYTKHAPSMMTSSLAVVAASANKIQRNQIDSKIDSRRTTMLHNIRRRVSIASSRERKRNVKATRTLGIIVGAFTVCWLPFFIVTTIRPIICSIPSSEDCIPLWLVRFVLLLGYINSALNPFIYIGFSPDLRATFRHLICCQCVNVDRKLARRDFRKAVTEELHAMARGIYPTDESIL